MRTNATVHGGREDMNIEDIHCQIVMRVQREKQLLRELEGGIPEPHDSSFVNGIYVDQYSSTSKQGHSMSTVIHMKEQDVLGPDFCAKRPVFLTHVPPPQPRAKQSSNAPRSTNSQ